MSNQPINRRSALQFIGATAGVALVNKTEGGILKTADKQPFIYCLNMATIRGHKLGFVKELEIASAAGFGSVEIWIDSLQEHLKMEER